MVPEMRTRNRKLSDDSGRWAQEATGMVEKTSGGACPQRSHRGWVEARQSRRGVGERHVTGFVASNLLPHPWKTRSV